MVATTQKPETEHKAGEVLDAIRRHPGLTADALALYVGYRNARSVRDRIRELRHRGEPITLGPDGVGYVVLGEDGLDDHQRAETVRHHRERCRSFLISHAQLMRQVGRMTATEIAQHMLIDLTVLTEDGDDEPLPSGMDQLARVPVERRRGLLDVFIGYLDAIANDPEAFRAERDVIREKHGGLFLTEGQVGMLRQAKELMTQAGV